MIDYYINKNKIILFYLKSGTTTVLLYLNTKNLSLSLNKVGT